MTKSILLFSISSILYLPLCAQIEEEVPVNNPVLRINNKRIYGKVLDTKASKGLEAASVQLYKVGTDTITGGRKDSLITGMLTRPNGDFSFSNISVQDSLRLVVSAVGYEREEEVFAVSGNSFEKDLGNINLQPAIQSLAAVTVVATKPALEMGIDRKVFNVEKSLTSTGGTAIDVMKNIPSISVDVEGNVQLRNSQPQIFVDGRPTILTLDQIPADNIERVELITNPSARFDAASTGGIINVVLKKNKRVGFNGVASLGAGAPDILNGNLNLNARQGKVNFFVSGGYNQSGGRAKGRTLRQNLSNGMVENYFNQYSTNERMRQFGSVRFGLDYFIDNRNIVSVSQNIVKGEFSNTEQQDQEYLNPSKVLERYGNRISTGNSDFDRYNTQLNFSHKFPQPGKELSANINYNYGSGANTTAIINSYFYPNGNEYSSPARVRNDGSNTNDQVTFQIDYINPISDDAKFETGARSYINNQHSIFNSFSVNNGTDTKLPLSNNYQYSEMVNAFYITYANKWKGFGYQAGLRAEHSKFDGTLVDSAKSFGYEYPNQFKRLFDALFPSLFITKPVNDNIELQVNYTRRIRRPNFWQLNPFIDISDPVNLRQGNPLLRPEFTNSFEFNYNQQYKGGNFLGVIYYRNNQGDVTRYSDTISAAQYQQLNNAAIDPNAILNTFINAQSTNRLGAEFTVQQKIGSNFDITPTVNMQYRRVKANVNQLNLSNRGFNWEAKLITNYKIVTKGPSLFNNLGFQVVGEYESPEVLAQGRQKEQYSVDFALRKDFLKDKKAALTFSINDVFNSLRYGTIYDTENFYQDSYGRRNVRNFRVNLTYKFGKADFSLFKRNETHNDDDDN